MQEKRAPRVRYSRQLYGEDVSAYRSASLRCKRHKLLFAEAGDYGKREMAAANGGAVLFSVVACRAELSQHRATLSPDSGHNTPEHR